jgi:hypothetical protein
MAAALFSFFRSLFNRSVGVPTMHSLRVHGRQPACRSYGPSLGKPLRVVRSSSRIVISGRMADVCAELDRLAAQEERQLFAAAAPTR